MWTVKDKIMIYTVFCGQENGDCAEYFKNAVSILIAKMYKICSFGGSVVCMEWLGIRFLKLFITF